MDYLQCGWDPASFLIISGNVFDPIIYYSHLAPLILSLFVGIFVFFANKKDPANRLLALITLIFAVWAFLDLILWASEKPEIIMFIWSILILFDFFIYFFSFLFIYLFAEGRLPTFRQFFLLFILFFPVLFLLSSEYNLTSFNYTNCEREAGEGLLWRYVYLIEIFYVFQIIFFSIKGYLRSQDPAKKKKIFYVATGLVLFLIAFSWGNLAGTFTDDWALGQYGLFGLPIFVGFLSFAIIRYQALNVRVVGVQILVLAIVLLVGAQFFYIKTHVNRILTGITLMLVLSFGIMLIRSIKKEIQRKNELQIMADKLAQANQRLKKLDQAKSEFISIASHQLRTPLTAIKGFISLILEGSYGNIDAPVRSALNKVYLSNERLIQLVEDLLSISRIESGRLEYKFRYWHVEEIVKDVVDMFRLRAREKGLDLELELPEHELPEIYIDGEKIREVISNLIDNATKYTKRGYVRVRIQEKGENVQIIIQDSGIGIIAEDIPYLFEKFSRGKDTNRLHANGTGLGLYVGKQIVEAHKGGLYAFSEGEDKGSAFVIELSMKKGEEEKGKDDGGEGVYERE